MSLRRFFAFQRGRELRARRRGAFVSWGLFERTSFSYAVRRRCCPIYSNFAEGFERDGNREVFAICLSSKARLGRLEASFSLPDFGYMDRGNI